MIDRPPTGDWTPSADDARNRWPTVLGYETLAELGRGGMGVVYKSRQVASDRLVALKLIRDGALAGPQDLARFRIEAEAAARMRHPNIVELYEIGEHQGRPYFAMELVEGGSLDRHLAGQPLPAAMSADLICTLARAVHHAHTQQVVHRDLKPANVLLASTVPLAPKITDFGLAKRLDSQSTAWTQEGAILGTASYMAPEQAAGRVRDIGPKVDVYALGAMLYEFLTGRPPFRGESWQQTIQQVIGDEPAPPTRFSPTVPRELETICLKCLEKEPDRRYASALELADDLGRFLDAKPVVATPLSETERLARLAARDGYEITGIIGRGPRSTVYHALQGAAKQPVAVKVFALGSCSQEAWNARLRHSAEVWTTLAHPNIVPVQRSGWWDGAPFLVMEYAPHGSLAAKIADKPIPLPQALDLMSQLAETVSYLHRQGVIHGNLKPSNVLLAADDIPRVADFRAAGGLFLGSRPADAVASLGFGYLTPETTLNPACEPRFYTDVYGLGLILYELLAGQPLFSGDNAEATLEQVRSQSPAPLASINNKVTPQIEATCFRCLQKNPWMRYARAYDLYMRLQYLRKKLTDGAAPEARRGKGVLGLG